MKPVSRRNLLGASLGGLLGAVACTPVPKVAETPKDRPSPARGAQKKNQASQRSASDLTSSPEPEAASETRAPDEATTADPEPSATKPQKEVTASFACERVEGVVGRNHGHVLLIAEADVLTGADKSYSLRGASSHDHTLHLSRDEFARIGQGETLRKKTEFGAGHRHRILVRCYPQVLPPDLVSACEAIIAGEDGHEVVIPQSHVRAALVRKYDIQGVSGHTHTLIIEPEHFRRLLAGEKLDLVTEPAAGHFHHAYIRYLGT